MGRVASFTHPICSFTVFMSSVQSFSRRMRFVWPAWFTVWNMIFRILSSSFVFPQQQNECVWRSIGDEFHSHTENPNTPKSNKNSTIKNKPINLRFAVHLEIGLLSCVLIYANKMQASRPDNNGWCILCVSNFSVLCYLLVEMWGAGSINTFGVWQTTELVY